MHYAQGCNETRIAHCKEETCDLQKPSGSAVQLREVECNLNCHQVCPDSGAHFTQMVERPSGTDKLHARGPVGMDGLTSLK